jgi:hypothetical protein
MGLKLLLVENNNNERFLIEIKASENCISFLLHSSDVLEFSPNENSN